MNNYNKNSKGLSISIDIEYDIDLARFYFDESIKKIDDEFFYIDSGNIDFDKINIWETMDDLKESQIKEFKNIISADYFNFKNRIEDLEPFLKHEIKSVEIKGYSQGDFATVYYLPNILKDLWGQDVNEQNMKKELVNIFYDAPIYLDLKIEQDEFSISDFEEIERYENDIEIIKAELLKVLKNKYSENQIKEIETFLKKVAF